MTVMEALEAAYQANPQAAESLIDDVVSDLLADEALDNAPLLNRAAGAVVSQKVSVAKRALLRQYASEVSQGRYPDDEVHKAAEWLAGIQAYTVDVVTKAIDDWDEKKHPRGAGGRFVRGVSQGRQVSPLRFGTDVSRVTPALRAGIAARGGTELPTNVDQVRAETAQAQYEQADEIMREFGAAFSPAERKQIEVFIQARTSDGLKTFSAPLSRAAHGMPDELFGTGGLTEKDDILSVEINPGDNADEKLSQRVSQFNTMGALGGPQLAAISALPKEKRDSLTQALMPRGPEEGRLKSLFNRFKVGGDVLEATGHDKLAGMARFMGTYGAEAEKVLDPRVRQTAYRYRGTEKEPDVLLMSQMNSPQMTQAEAVARGGVHGPAADAAMQGVNRPGATPIVEGSTRHHIEQARRTGEQPTEDQLNMRVRSDVAANHLLETIPMNRMVAALSQKAGNILPSQGVLIDADGDVVSQAVGYGDDTYLPFDYTNMKRSMRGGQYVRTRVQGGLTGEDIAAAVGNGARMATVVSSSGVHSIEFDPNMRGARGGSDKARSMYRRYLQILDAVENSGMYTQDIDAREKARLRSRAGEIVGNRDSQEFRDTYKRMEQEARDKATELTEEEMDGLMEQAQQQVAREGGSRNPQHQQKRINEVYEELEETATNEKASRLRLNAEGYSVALQTLQQQFPYFIRNVTYEPLVAGKGGEEGFLNSRGQKPVAGSLRQRLKATDEGYMRPGGTRAASVRTGFYRTDESSPRQKEAVAGPRFEQERAAAEAKTGVAGTQPGAEGAGGGAAAPGTPGAPAPAAPGLTGPVTGPQGGLAERVARFSGAAKEQREVALTQLQNAMSTLEGQRTDQRGATSSEPWEQVATGNNQRVAQWFLGQPDAAQKAALSNPASASRIATALGDRGAVETAIKQVFNATSGIKDLIDGGADFGGAQTPEQALNWIADQAMTVVDADLMTQPFVNAREGDAARWYTGTKPQALKIKGTDINTLDTPEKFNAFLKDNSDIATMARKLGTQEGSDKFKPSMAVAEDASERIQVLQALPAVVTAALKEKAGPAQTPVPAATILQEAGVSMKPSKFLGALERITGSAHVNSDQLASLKPLAANHQIEADKVQQAWALVNAGRAHAALYGGGGEVAGPKVEEQGEVWLHKAASTRPASTALRWPEPRLQVVRKDASPLAREISRRRRAGLDPLPG